MNSPIGPITLEVTPEQKLAVKFDRSVWRHAADADEMFGQLVFELEYQQFRTYIVTKQTLYALEQALVAKVHRMVEAGTIVRRFNGNLWQFRQ